VDAAGNIFNMNSSLSGETFKDTNEDSDSHWVNLDVELREVDWSLDQELVQNFTNLLTEVVIVLGIPILDSSLHLSVDLSMVDDEILSNNESKLNRMAQLTK